MLIFDQLKLSLCHAWLPDPNDKTVFQTVHGKSYNQLAEIIVAGQEAARKQGEVRTSPIEYETPVSAGENSSKKEPLEKQISDGLCVEEFLNQSASQITYYGAWRIIGSRSMSLTS